METTTETLDFDAAFDKAWEGEADTEETHQQQTSIGGEELEASKISPSTEEKDEVESEEESQSEKPEAETQEAEPLIAPVFWEESTKEAFYKLGRAEQELVLAANKSSQGDYTRKTQELASKSREVDEINAVFEPYEADLAALGQRKPELIDYMLRWNNLINRDPDRAIAKIIELTGAKYPQSAHLQQQSQGDPARPTALEQRLAAAEARLEQYESGIATQSLEKQLLSIANEKDGSGQPVRPMFQELLPAIQGLVLTIAGQPGNEELSEVELVDLAYKQAYEPYKAIRKQELTKQVQRSKSANLASSSITSSSSGSSVSRPKIKSTEDAVTRAFEEHNF